MSSCAPRTARAATSARPRSRTCTRSRPGPTAARAAAPRRASHASPVLARRPATPCAPLATPAPFRPSSDLLHVDLVLLLIADRQIEGMYRLAYRAFFSEVARLCGRPVAEISDP